MQPVILVVDDEAPIRDMLAFSLGRAEMTVELAAGGNEALERLGSTDSIPDLIVLDWMMPDLDGMQLTRTVRGMSGLEDLPIIMLTARGTERDRTCGLDGGADDYMVKPFSTRELISRVRAVLRRAQPRSASPGASAGTDTLKVGGLTLDLDSHRVMAGDRPLNMGPTEFRILKLFMSRPGRAWSRDQLLAEIWADGQTVEQRTVDVHIRRLRKALEPGGLAGFVQTVRGHGYRFSDIA
ncbi:MAG: winged helix-turn-helix domain-containing protein [Wenzhouxiangellaceae bacterium]|nr:winged helix-turn-helix domain-containing protein [Wenzhouxiangellaceae bacterium]MBS3822840.1 winged helix-turn-helix domain-containing protein [Wenzhouxiangellaceae bacterium]